mmetsp:Transcript_20138/g.39994  ORF Transcript_20138/g.39994 Transcript_20138/m.39994 type:complete len:223 (+) Transcript_20138:1111-1779(+)
MEHEASQRQVFGEAHQKRVPASSSLLRPRDSVVFATTGNIATANIAFADDTLDVIIINNVLVVNVVDVTIVVDTVLAIHEVHKAFHEVSRQLKIGKGTACGQLPSCLLATRLVSVVVAQEFLQKSAHKPRQHNRRRVFCWCCTASKRCREVTQGEHHRRSKPCSWFFQCFESFRHAHSSDRRQDGTCCATAIAHTGRGGFDLKHESRRKLQPSPAAAQGKHR